MVVTRFAPSPTGYLHIGGARTVLFNWLFARKLGGKFLLRIEDTDIKRNTPTATAQVISDLRWLGIDWDEGPQVGGPNGPYFQSQRKDIYDKYINQLAEQGKAYYCFESAEELVAMRKAAEAEKKGFVYQRPEKFPDTEDVKKARSQGKDITVRFVAAADEPVIVDDIVRGRVEFAPIEVADFIIRKSDGMPTYHFAVVVDDELMGVTHVIRGVEHLMNTPGHQLLQKALGFRVPVYAHISVTVSEDGGKLSKRQKPKTLRDTINSLAEVDAESLAKVGGVNADEIKSFLARKTTPDMPVIDTIAKHLGVHLPEINIIDFLKSGYLPETMINFIALLGWNPGGDQEIMSAGELIDCFDISRLTKSNSLFDRKKLLAFNTEHIKILSPDKLLSRFKDYLNVIESPVIAAADNILARLLEINAGARTLAEIEKKCQFLFVANDAIEYDPKAVKKVLLKHDGLAMLRIVRGKLADMEPFGEEKIEQMLRSLAEEKQLGLGKVAQPLRVAICGNTISPPIFDSVNMLGKKNTLARIDITLQKFPTHPKTEGD